MLIVRLAEPEAQLHVSRSDRRGARLAYGDTLRLLGCLAVVVQHAADSVVQRYGTVGVTDWWACNLVVAGTKWAVPVFVMLSGALLLDSDRDETPAAFYRRRLARVGVPTLFWSAFYLLVPFIGGTRDHTLVELLDRLVRGVPYYHMFFMFVIVGLYLFTPMLRVFVRHASRAECGVAICAALAAACLGDAVAVWKGYEPNAFTLFVPYVGYFLAGHQFRDLHLSRPGRHAVLFVLIMSVLVASVGTGLLVGWLGCNAHGRYLCSYFSPTVIVMSLSVFLAIGDVFRQEIPTAGWFQWVASSVSAATFGIYLIHPFIFRVADRLGIDTVLSSMWLRVPFMVAVVFLASWILTELLGRTPGLCRIAGYQDRSRRSPIGSVS